MEIPTILNLLFSLGISIFTQKFIGSEASTAVAFVWAGGFFAISSCTTGFAFLLGVGAPALPAIGVLIVALLGIAVIDLKKLVIPDLLIVVVAFTGWFAAFSAANQTRALADATAGMVAAGLLVAVVRLYFRQYRGIEGLGWGDVKLSAAGGVWSGWYLTGPMLLVAALGGIATAMIMAKGLPDRRTAFPFGPGLCLGIAFVAVVPFGFAPTN